MADLRGFILFCVMGVFCFVAGIYNGKVGGADTIFNHCNEKGFYEISDSKFIECAAIDLKAIYTKRRE